MCKKSGVLLASAVLLFLTACDLFSNKPDELLQKIDAQVAYDNAPFANVSVGIIPGSLSAVPTEAPREKVGYPFTVQAAANSGYGFSGWRVLTKAQWEDLDLQDSTFETDFITAALNANADNALATISDTLGVDGKPSGGASITAYTANPLVIVPYATLRPAISSASYPAMNARDINYRIPIAIRFDAPVAAESFMWQEGETHDPWDIKNVTISAVKANGDSVPPETIEALFNTGVTSGMGLDDSGKILFLKLDAAGNLPLTASDIEQCQITIALGGDIERRGSPGVKIMPRQELVFTITTASSGVSTLLSGLGISIGGLPPTGYNFESTNYKYTINTFAKSGDIVITPTAVGGTLVDITILGFEGTVASGSFKTQAIAAGKNTIQVNIAPSGGSVLSTYIVAIENYPAVDMPAVTLTPAAGQISATWGTIDGASSYEVRYSTGNNQGTATAVPGATSPYTIPGLGAGTTYNVWVRAIAGSGDNILYGNYSVMKTATTFSSTARLASLSVSGTTLSPSFNADTYNYSVNVNNLTSLSSINAEAQNNGSVAVSGNSDFVPGRNLNKITIAVTPQAGGTPQNYNITVNNYPAAAAPTVELTTPAAGQISVSWGTAVGGASSYEVRYSTGTSQDTATPQPVDGAGTTSANITGLSAGVTYNVWVRAVAGSGDNILYGNYSAVKSATTYSSTARLSALTVGGGALYPVFSEEQYNYTVTLNNQETAYTVTPTAKNSGTLAMTLNAESQGTVTSGTAKPLTLAKGRNTVSIAVTPQAGGTPQTYTITIDNYPAAAVPVVTLTTPVAQQINASWTPAGGVGGATSYELRYSTGTNPDTAAPQPVEGAGTTSALITGLAAGTTYNVWVRAIAGSGANALYGYYSAVKSATTQSSVARLATLLVTGATLSPAFSADTYSYSVNVYDLVSLSVTAGAQLNGSVKIGLNGVTPATNSPASLTLLVKGKNTVTVRVTPQNGGTTQDYTLIVNNGPANAPAISGVTGGAGQISVTWGTVTGADSYRVFYNQSPNVNTAMEWTSDRTSPSVITGLSSDTTYYAWVVAVAGTETNTVESGYSAAGQATTHSSTARLQTLTANGQNITLYDGVYGYTVETINLDTLPLVATARNSGTVAMKISNLGTTNTAFSGGGAIANGKNTISLVVTPQNGNASAAQTYTLTVNNLPATLPQLTVTAGVQTPNGKLTVSWPQVTGADSYKVYYGQSSNIAGATQSAEPITGTTTRTTTITNTSITADTTFYVWVRAVAGTGTFALDGPYSADKSARTPSDDPRLAALSLSGKTFSPPFNPDLSDYEIVQDFPNTTTTLTAGEFSAVPYSSGATLSISGSNSLAVKADGNTLTLHVTTQYNTTKDYKIKAYRKPTAPAWAPATFSNYRPGGVDVTWSIDGVEEVVDGYQVYQNTMNTYLAGGIPFDIAGQAQTSLGTVGMTAENTYYYYVRSFTVDPTSNRFVYSDYRADKTLKTITTLNNLTVATHGLTSTFNPQNSSPETLIDYTTANISVTPTFNQNDQGISSVTVNGTAINTGQAQSIPISFSSTDPETESFWHSSTPVTVTAQHTSYTRVYNLGATRRSIKIGAGSGNDYTSLDNAFSANNNVVYLAATDQIIPLTASYVISSGTRTIRLRGSGSVTITVAGDFAAFNLTGGTLNLGGADSTGTLYIEPVNPDYTYNTPLIDMGNSGSQLNMYNNVHVRNRRVSSLNCGAGGVRVLGGTFNMYGGYITGNRVIIPVIGSGVAGAVGGVYINGGTFNGYGGYIINNTVSSGSNNPNLYPPYSPGATVITTP